MFQKLSNWMDITFECKLVQIWIIWDRLCKRQSLEEDLKLLIMWVYMDGVVFSKIQETYAENSENK